MAWQVLDETVVVNHSDDMFAPVGLLRVVKCHTEPKNCPAGQEMRNECKAREKMKNIAIIGHGRISEAPCASGKAESKVELALGETPQDIAGRAREVTVAAREPLPLVAKESVPLAYGRATRPAPAFFLPHVHQGSGGLVYLSGARAPESRSSSSAVAGEAEAIAEAEVQMASCLAAVRAALERSGVSLRDVCFVHLYLRDMRHFQAVNREYCK